MIRPTVARVDLDAFRLRRFVDSLNRLGEVEAGIRGAAYDSPDPAYSLEKALTAAFGRDPECTRAELDIRFVLRAPAEVFARPGLRDKALELGSGWRDAPSFGPTREQLLALASAA